LRLKSTRLETLGPDRSPSCAPRRFVSTTSGRPHHPRRFCWENDNDFGPWDVARQAANVVASLLQWPNDVLRDHPKEWFIQRFEEIFNSEGWTSDKDRAIHASLLLLLGEQRYLAGLINEDRIKTERQLTILESAHGAASGASVAGFVASAVEPWFKKAVISLSNREMEKYSDAWDVIIKAFEDNFESSILRSGQVKVHGKDEPIPVDHKSFDTWFRMVFKDKLALERIGGVARS